MTTNHILLNPSSEEVPDVDLISACFTNPERKSYVQDIRRHYRQKPYQKNVFEPIELKLQDDEEFWMQLVERQPGKRVYFEGCVFSPPWETQ